MFDDLYVITWETTCKSGGVCIGNIPNVSDSSDSSLVVSVVMTAILLVSTLHKSDKSDVDNSNDSLCGVSSLLSAIKPNVFDICGGSDCVNT